jgi:hypothetical protein
VSRGNGPILPNYVVQVAGTPTAEFFFAVKQKMLAKNHYISQNYFKNICPHVDGKFMSPAYILNPDILLLTKYKSKQKILLDQNPLALDHIYHAEASMSVFQWQFKFILLYQEL